MGIMTKTVVSGILKQDGRGALFLIGRMSNGKQCVVNISDTSNGKKDNLSKDVFLSNLSTLVEKSNEKAIEKAKEANDNEKLVLLEKNLKTRIDSLKKEGKEIKLLLEESTGVYLVKDDKYIINANGTPTKTKSGFIFHNIKPIEDDKNEKETIPVKTTVYGMVYKRDEFDKLTAEQKATLEYQKGSPDADKWRYKNISVSDVLKGNVDYSTVQLKASLSKFADLDDLKTVFTVDTNYLNYVSTNHNKNFQPSKNRFSNETNVFPKVFASVPQSKIFDLLGVEDLKGMLKEIFILANKILEGQKDESGKPKKYYIPFTDGTLGMNIDHTNIEKCDKLKVLKVYEGLLAQFQNKVSNIVSFLKPTIKDDAKFYSETRKTLIKTFKDLNKPLSMKELNEKIALAFIKRDGEKTDATSQNYLYKIKGIETFNLLEEIDDLKNSKSLENYAENQNKLLAYAMKNKNSNIPLSISFPLKSFDFSRKDDRDYKIRYKTDIQEIVEKMVKDVLRPIEKTALSVLLNNSGNDYVEAMKENAQNYIALDMENKKINYKPDTNGFTVPDRLMLKNLEANIQKPTPYEISDGLTINPINIPALVIPKDLTKNSFIALDGVGGRNFGYPESNSVYAQVLGAKYLSFPMPSSKEGDINFEAIPQIPFNPLTGEETTVKPKRTRRTKAEMEALRNGATTVTSENISKVEQPNTPEEEIANGRVDIVEEESIIVTSELFEGDITINIENVPTSFNTQEAEVSTSSVSLSEEANILLSLNNDGLDIEELNNFLGGDFVFDDKAVDLQALNDANQKLSPQNTVIETSVAPIL